ncbi:hypothetical protein [Paenisporosarcina quisquiliarum]|uniref:hypothetical protein n=1 Tax=Paenisporosarcina quisquiliarum TaxID=365346 RepID=UPI003736B1B6
MDISIEEEVQDRIVHTDVQTTMNIYAHVTEKTKEAAIQKFEKLPQHMIIAYILTTFLTTFN